MSTHGKVHGFDENFCKVEVPTMKQVLAKIYPVGAIYMSVSPTSPSWNVDTVGKWQSTCWYKYR